MSNPSRPNVKAAPPFDAVADLARFSYVDDDFIVGTVTGDDATTAGIGKLRWLVTDVAGAADSDVEPHVTAADIKGHPGVIALNTGPTTPADGDEASLFLPNVDAVVLYDPTDALSVSDEFVLATAWVRFPSVTAIEFNFGFFDAKGVAGRGVNSVSCELDISADTEFNLVVVDGSTATAVASTITAAVDTWYKIDVFANEDEAQLYINDVYAAHTNSANIPDDEPLGVGFKVATETAGEKSVLIDAFQLRVPVSR